MPDFDPAPDSDGKTVSAVEALTAAFRPLLQRLSDDLEPAVILSEVAVSGE